jgi:hypothetical protein
VKVEELIDVEEEEEEPVPITFPVITRSSGKN